MGQHYHTALPAAWQVQAEHTVTSTQGTVRDTAPSAEQGGARKTSLPHLCSELALGPSKLSTELTNPYSSTFTQQPRANRLLHPAVHGMRSLLPSTSRTQGCSRRRWLSARSSCSPELTMSTGARPSPRTQPCLFTATSRGHGSPATCWPPRATGSLWPPRMGCGPSSCPVGHSKRGEAVPALQETSGSRALPFRGSGETVGCAEKRTTAQP